MVTAVDQSRKILCKARKDAVKHELTIALLKPPILYVHQIVPSFLNKTKKMVKIGLFSRLIPATPFLFLETVCTVTIISTKIDIIGEAVQKIFFNINPRISYR